MEKPVKYDTIQPRYLRYRSHFKIYLILLLTISAFICSFWGYQVSHEKWSSVYEEFSIEFWASLTYFVSFAAFHTFWLRFRLNRSVQVFPDHVRVHNFGKSEVVQFSDVESVSVVCWSVFYFKMKDGKKHYFSSSLERVDYIWEGINVQRPGLIAPEVFDEFRTKLVQYDHHQKRKEWFFRHKLVDIFNWIVLPIAFISATYMIQTREVIINQQGLYFFRLFMYGILVLMTTTFIYSIVLKKFIFDKRVKLQLGSAQEEKIRDLEFEGVIVHRSKMLQMMTAAFLFTLVVRTEVNLYSLTKIKEDLSSFNLTTGKTLVVDNRYNCTTCRYPVKDGDLVVFGKGTVGQIMAIEGEMVGAISQDHSGRVIASENIQEVPKSHIAVRLSNNKEILMVRVGELIGKIKK